MFPHRFVLCVAILAVGSAAGNLIRGKSDGPVFAGKDSTLSKLDIDGNELSVPEEEIAPPQDNAEKKCGEIGEFCVNHSDCCSFACLGYMKKCVSGSG
ncbi:unnamed protein product, partial [Iphiclides podalirius]